MDVSAIIAKIRQALARRGTTSMIALQRAFKIMDDDNSKAISRSEFQKAMRDFGVGLTKAEVDTVFRFYDKDGSGDLSFHEFLRGVRGEMNERRKALVQQAFQKLDHNGNGRVELDDIARLYVVARVLTAPRSVCDAVCACARAPRLQLQGTQPPRRAGG